MKGMLLALLCFFLLMGLSLFSFRIYRGKKYLRVFFTAYAVSVLIYLGLYFLTPENLGFLPPFQSERAGPAEFWNGFLILSLLFHCFADVSYTTVLTGFSTQLVVLLHERGTLTVNDIQASYGLAGCPNPVTEWRLNHLLKGRYIKTEGSGYRLLSKGKRIAKFAQFFQKLFNTDAGG